MSTRTTIVIVLALIFGGSAAVMVRQLVLNDRTNQEAVETVDILVPKADISVGYNVTLEKVDTVPWPKANVPEDALLPGQLEEIDIKSVKTPLVAGQPILKSSFGILPMLDISAGKVARIITIPGESFNSVGLLQPGNYVNVSFIRNGAIQMPETVLRAVRVIAVGGIGLSNRSEEEDEPITPSTSVTLEVNEAQDNALLLMQDQGKLALTLLPPMTPEEAAKRNEDIDIPKDLVPPEDVPASEDTLPAAIETTRVLVASRHIRKQDRITRASFEVREVPVDDLEGQVGVLKDLDSESIVGSYSLSDVNRGSLLIADNFPPPGSLRGLLGKGMVGYKLTSTTPMLPIAPEDRVEILFTPEPIENSRNDREERVAPPARSLMKGIRVIAVNDTVDSETQPQSIQSVILELRSQEANMLSFAQKHGTLETVVLSDPDTSELNDRVIIPKKELDELVTPPEPKQEPPVEPQQILVKEPVEIAQETNTLTIITQRGSSIGQTTLQVFSGKSDK